MVSIVQAVFVATAAWMVARTVRHMRVRRVPVVWAALMCVVWLGVGVVALVPQTTDTVARAVGVERGADLLVYVAIMALVAVVFRLVMKLERVERDVTALVREDALRAMSKPPHEDGMMCAPSGPPHGDDKV